MGSRNHELRNKMQVAMMDLPKDYTSGDLLRCLAEAAVKFMDETCPELKSYEKESRGVIGQQYIVFYNDHGSVYGVPKQIVLDHYNAGPRLNKTYVPTDKDLEIQLKEWMYPSDFKDHVLLFKKQDDPETMFKNMEDVENFYTITFDKDSYTR